MFAGKNFWVAQRVPLRGLRIEQIEQHGGHHVLLEKQADVLIWDHIRAGAPPGAVSWTFIEESVKSGEAVHIEDHVCGPAAGAVRDVGSRTAPKSGREPFTSLDDRVLYKWGAEAEAKGISVKGNEIWKQLERVNNRHSWQSWRARWVKKLSGEDPPEGWEDAPIHLPAVKDRVSTALEAPRTDTQRVHSPPAKPQPKTGAPELAANMGPPRAKERPGSKLSTPQVDGASSSLPAPADLEPMAESVVGSREEPRVESEARSIAASKAPPKATPTDKFFTSEDFYEIYDNINAILGVDKVEFLEGWENWAEHTPHTAGEWMVFFRKSVMPVHRKYDHLGAAGQRLVLNWTDEYIKANPKQPFTGWSAIEGVFPASPSKKRPREDEDEEEQVVPESPSQTVTANSGVKRQRVERIHVISETIVQKTEQAIEEVSKTIESSPRTEGPNTIDLTTLEDTSSSSDCSEELLTQQAPEEGSDGEALEDGDSLPVDAAAGDEEATRNLGTQAILDAETQAVDFDVPEPEEGFVDTEDSEDGSLEQYDQELIDQQLQQEVSRNAGGMDGEVETTILGMPESFGRSAELAPQGDDLDKSDAESVAFSTRSQSTDEESFDDLTKRLMREGHSRDNIFTAIVATSGNPALYDIVLESLQREQGVPKSMRGVWTEEDDAHLQGGDSRMIKRVEEKHGKRGLRGVSNREKFLKGLNAESESDG